MTKIFELLGTVVVLSIIPILISAKISDKRKCFDPECSEVVSLGKTLVRYVSKDPDLLSFPANSDVKIFSKEAGNRLDLWGVEINNERGYVPKQFIRENKVIRSNLQFLVPTQIHAKEEEQQPQVPGKDVNIPDVQSSDTSNQSENSNLEEKPAILREQNLDYFDPIFVTPSYESYDGIILPIDSNNFSTVTLQTAQNGTSEEQQEDPVVSPTTAIIPDISPSLPKPEQTVSLESTFPEISEENVNYLKTDSSIPSFVDTTLLSNKIDNIIDVGNSIPETTVPEKEDVAPAGSISDNIKTKVLDNVSEEIKSNTVLSEGDIATSATETDFIANTEVAFATDNITNAELIGAESIATGNQESGANDFQEHNIVSISESVVTSDEAIVSDSIVPNLLLNTEEIEKKLDNFVTNVNDIVDDSMLKTTLSEEPVNNVSEKSDYNATDEEVYHISNDSSLNYTDQLNYNETEENVTAYVDLGTVVSDFEAMNVEDENMTVVSDDITKEDLIEIANVPDPSLQQDPTILSENINPQDIPFEIFHRSLLSAEKELERDSENLEVKNEIPIVENTRQDISQPIDQQIVETEYVVTPPVENVSQETETIKIEHTMSVVEEAGIMSQQEGEIKDTSNLEEPSLMPKITHEIENVCLSDKCPSQVQEIEKEESYANAMIAYTRIFTGKSGSLRYMIITAVTVLFFSLGYYFIESRRQDALWIARINNLEKDLMVTREENKILNASIQNSTRERMEALDDSVSKNEFTILKNELISSEQARVELEENNAALLRELELAEETVHETHRLMNDSISSHTAALSELEDMQKLLNTKQAENESLSKLLAAQKAEGEKISVKVIEWRKKYEKLEAENKRLNDELNSVSNKKTHMEKMLVDQIQRLENQIKAIGEEKKLLSKKLKKKELEFEELSNNITHLKLSDVDISNLYEISHIKAEALQAMQERDALQQKLNEMEKTHQELEGHVTSIREAAADLTEQCALAEKEKKRAEARLEVLEEKELQRQKDAKTLLETQGEVASTIEKLQVMEKDIDLYKQQIAILKREIIAQEKYYKDQIKDQENKAHDQWMLARNHERRLQEFKAESSQLRSRLSLMEKNSTEVDTDMKSHRIGTNEETAASPPPFIGADNSSPPVIFPPAPPYLYGPGFPGRFVPPPPIPGNLPSLEPGQRPPPLGGRLSTPPPLIPLPPVPANSSRFDKMNSPGPPLSPPPNLLHRIPPPHIIPPFGPDGHTIHSPLPLPPRGVAPLPDTHNTWGDHTQPVRSSGFRSHQRDQRTRNNGEPLHSSRESLDRSYSDV